MLEDSSWGWQTLNYYGDIDKITSLLFYSWELGEITLFIPLTEIDTVGAQAANSS